MFPINPTHITTSQNQQTQHGGNSGQTEDAEMTKLQLFPNRKRPAEGSIDYFNVSNKKRREAYPVQIKLNNNSIADNNTPEKNGVMKFKDGSVYSGDWNNGTAQGHGTMITPDFTYVGNWHAGRAEGEGTIHFTDGLTYTGRWKNGIPNGMGSLKLGNSYKEKGHFIGFQLNGLGTIHEPNQPTIIKRGGNFKDGKQDGLGYRYYSDGAQYQGNFNNDEINCSNTRCFTRVSALEEEKANFIKKIEKYIASLFPDGDESAHAKDSIKYNSINYKNHFNICKEACRLALIKIYWPNKEEIWICNKSGSYQPIDSVINSMGKAAIQLFSELTSTKNPIGTEFINSIKKWFHYYYDNLAPSSTFIYGVPIKFLGSSFKFALGLINYIEYHESFPLSRLSFRLQKFIFSFLEKTDLNNIALSCKYYASMEIIKSKALRLDQQSALSFAFNSQSMDMVKSIYANFYYRIKKDAMTIKEFNELVNTFNKFPLLQKLSINFNNIPVPTVVSHFKNFLTALQCKITNLCYMYCGSINEIDIDNLKIKPSFKENLSNLVLAVHQIDPGKFSAATFFNKFPNLKVFLIQTMSNITDQRGGLCLLLYFRNQKIISPDDTIEPKPGQSLYQGEPLTYHMPDVLKWQKNYRSFTDQGNKKGYITFKNGIPNKGKLIAPDGTFTQIIDGYPSTIKGSNLINEFKIGKFTLEELF